MFVHLAILEFEALTGEWRAEWKEKHKKTGSENERKPKICIFEWWNKQGFKEVEYLSVGSTESVKR